MHIEHTFEIPQHVAQHQMTRHVEGQTDSSREGWLNLWFRQTTSDLAPSSSMMVCATQLSTLSNFEFEQT